MHHCENYNKQFTTRQSRLRHEKLYCQLVKKQENGGPAAKKQKISHTTGWTLVKILHLELNVNYYIPLKASSYIPLPPSAK
ncbi:hypothetical protein TcasGA2_TC005022 [Tribolium castaneum]|uniref:Uncharacterized protein n=1 Tax=Tribolium castaneum TaxID=7070 RepID=D7GXG8_TRICA|nr:hypothetical protein TcasGA2_TC005022 [Tribolium castaneum]